MTKPEFAKRVAADAGITAGQAASASPSISRIRVVAQ
jgi:hypothetical protein